MKRGARDPAGNAELVTQSDHMQNALQTWHLMGLCCKHVKYHYSYVLHVTCKHIGFVVPYQFQSTCTPRWLSCIVMLCHHMMKIQLYTGNCMNQAILLYVIAH